MTMASFSNDVPWLDFGCLLHQGLATDDETADVDELLARVLWYYPSSDGPKQRLEALTLLETLIAMAGAFCGPPAREEGIRGGANLRTAMIGDTRWCMVEPEADVRLVWAIRKHKEDPCDEVAGPSIVLQAYDRFVLSRGTIAGLLSTGNLTKSMDKVFEVQARRRLARKARRKLEMKRDDAGGIDQTEAELEEALGAAVGSLELAAAEDPTPRARRVLAAFFQRHLGRMPGGYVTAADDMPGFEHRSLPPATFMDIHFMQRQLNLEVKGASACVVLLNRAVAWNGIGTNELCVLYPVLLDARADAPAALESGFLSPTNDVVVPRRGEALRCAVGTLPGDADIDDYDDLPDGQVAREVWHPALNWPAATPHEVPCAWHKATRDPNPLRGPPRPGQGTSGGERLLVYVKGPWTIAVIADAGRCSANVTRVSRRKLTHFCREVRTLLDKHLDEDELLVKIAQEAPTLKNARSAAAVDGVRLVYFNRANMSLKTYPGTMPIWVQRQIAHAHKAFEQDFPHEELQEEITELPEKQGWLVAKKDGKRHIFLHIDKRYPSIHDVMNCVEHLKKGLLANIRVRP